MLGVDFKTTSHVHIIVHRCPGASHRSSISDSSSSESASVSGSCASSCAVPEPSALHGGYSAALLKKETLRLRL